VIEVVEDLARGVALIQRPAFTIGIVESATESTEQLGHRQVGLPITEVDGGIEDHRITRRIVGKVATPEIAMQ